MEIDNQTKAAVLRELQEHFEGVGEKGAASQISRIADKLDPPEKPIHPHEGCEGMVVQHKDSVTGLTVFDPDMPNSGNYIVPRSAYKIPAFLCDGTRPEWVNDDDMVWFYAGGHVDEANYIYWSKCNGMHFCVLDPVEVQ